jgi:hypothetical protein
MREKKKASMIEGLVSQYWLQKLGWTLLHFLWQGTAIAVIYLVLRAVLGRSLSAQGRYVLACLALAAMAISCSSRIGMKLSPVVWQFPGTFQRVAALFPRLRGCLGGGHAWILDSTVRRLAAHFASEFRSTSGPSRVAANAGIGHGSGQSFMVWSESAGTPPGFACKWEFQR